MGLVAARLDMLQRLEDRCLAKNYRRERREAQLVCQEAYSTAPKVVSSVGLNSGLDISSLPPDWLEGI